MVFGTRRIGRLCRLCRCFAGSGVVLAMMLAFAWSLPVQAEGSGWQADWVCGKAVKPDQTLVNELLAREEIHGYAVNDVTLPILVGENMEGMGTVVFVQRAGQWQMYPVAEGQLVVDAFSTPAYDRFMLFTMWGIEGPGTEYTVLRSKGQFADMDCGSVVFPENLNTPAWANEYLNLEDFNIDKDGNGVLIGSVYREQGGEEVKDWYRYTSTDWGKTWTAPSPVELPGKQGLPGVFLPAVGTEPSKALLDSLLASLPKLPEQKKGNGTP